ncbi:Alpha-terpineol synthase [Nymphaea thermarum]|nr:Alpha-terpineol synthase [Nymphaea thermarum]
MAVHLASLSTPFVASPKLVPSTKASFKPWSTSLVRCEPRAEGCSRSAAQRRPSRYQPSTWNYDFIQSITSATSIKTQRTRVEKLRREVRQIITSTTEQVAQLELINSLERLGVAYHFEIEIRRSLDAISTSTRGFEDLYSFSLRFRILRQYGYNVSSECFSRFSDQSSRFFENLCEDVRGLLSLYEASQIACEEETVLEEASAFSSEHLRARISRMDKRMSRQVQRALQVPLHRRVRRVEAREHIETFERTDRRSQVLHEFARLDFNMVQTIHQRELRELSGWWRDLGLGEHISFARDRLVESYFMAVGKMHEPQFSQYRMQLTRDSYLMATIEDIFGEHQSVEELERFVQVVERWDLQAAEQLRQSLRVFYAAVYNTTNQISYTILKRHGRDITSHMRRATPRLEEYLSNIRAAMTGPILLPAYFFLSQNIEEKAIQQLQSESNIFNLSSMIVRLLADLQRSRARVAEEQARQHIRKLLRDAWRRLNRELLLAQQHQQQIAFSRSFMNVALNIARVSQCMYDYEDGVGVLEHESMDHIFKTELGSAKDIKTLATHLLSFMGSCYYVKQLQISV